MFRLRLARVQGLQVCLVQFPKSQQLYLSVLERYLYGRPIVGGYLLEGETTWVQKLHLARVLRVMQEF